MMVEIMSINEQLEKKNQYGKNFDILTEKNFIAYDQFAF